MRVALSVASVYSRLDEPSGGPLSMRYSLSQFRSGSAALAAAALGGFMLLTVTSRVRADDGCQRRIAHADHKLHEAIEHHGYRSEQARHWRHELHEAREYCWKVRHRWWDEDNRRWHSDRDWDEEDHYRRR
jgi:hypothetical protein